MRCACLPGLATKLSCNVSNAVRGAHVVGLPTRSRLGHVLTVATAYVCSMALDAGQVLKSTQEAMPMPNSITDDNSEMTESDIAPLAAFFEHVENIAKYVSVLLTIVGCLTGGSFARRPRLYAGV